MEDYRNILMAAGGAIFAIVVIVVVGAVLRRRRRKRDMQAPLPLIPFAPGRTAGGPPRPDGTLPPLNAPRQDWASARTPTRSAPVDETPRYAPPARPTFAPPPVDVGPPAPRYAAPGNALADTARPNEMVDGAEVDGASMRYWRPADGTLQFLPGRLEVIAGRDAGHEIRFVRTPGPDGARVTFGRAEGAPYRHVQLREPTVSRAHARMTLENGNGPAVTRPTPPGQTNASRWRLENLSATNPVVVNGRPLAADGSAECSVSLGEGDRIEMGEVVFRFHER